MPATRTYRVQLAPSTINALGQFCTDGTLVDTRMIQAKSLPELSAQIKALVTQAGIDCRAFVQICGVRRPSSSFRDWSVANLLHITAAA